MIFGSLCGASANVSDPANFSRDFVLVEATGVRHQICQEQGVNNITIQWGNGLGSVRCLMPKFCNLDVPLPIGKRGFKSDLANMAAIIEPAIDPSDHPGRQNANDDASQSGQCCEQLRVYNRRSIQGALNGYAAGVALLFTGWAIWRMFRI